MLFILDPIQDIYCGSECLICGSLWIIQKVTSSQNGWGHPLLLSPQATCAPNKLQVCLFESKKLLHSRNNKYLLIFLSNHSLLDILDAPQRFLNPPLGVEF